MFEDTRHEIKIIRFQDKEYVKRSLKKVCENTLYKEYLLQKMLSPHGITPAVKCFKNSYFLEELISKQQQRVNKEFIKKVAICIKKLHRVDIKDISPKLIPLLNNNYLVKSANKIDYLLLYKDMTKQLHNDQAKKILSSIKISRYLYNKKNLKFAAKICINHGDLNLGNVLVDMKGSVKLIDWSDSRFDDAEADLAQIIHHLNLTDQQINSFLEIYSEDFINHEILNIRRILLIVYDIVDRSNNYKNIDNEKIEQLRFIINNK